MMSGEREAIRLWREDFLFLTLRKLMLRRRRVCGFLGGKEGFEDGVEGWNEEEYVVVRVEWDEEE